MLCIMCCIFPQSINRANSVTLGGTTYRRKDVIVVDVKDEETSFCQIVDILETPAAKCLFVTCILTTTFFERHYHAFKVYPNLKYCSIIINIINSVITTLYIFVNLMAQNQALYVCLKLLIYISFLICNKIYNIDHIIIMVYYNE